MSYMFYKCSKLTTLDISKINTSKVTNMRYMFCGCSSLTTLNVSNFDTSQVTDMNCMFTNCTNLTTLDISNFDTSQVTDMSCMFSSCENLTALDVSYFDTSNVVSTKAMFYLCLNLRELNLSVFDMSNVTDTTDMLDYCSNLTTLYTPKVYSSQIVNLPASYYNISDSTDTKKYTSFTSGTFSSSVELRKIFTLTVNPNGGTWEGSTASQNFSIAYGQTKTISNPTRTGDVFAGWTISGNGSSLNDTTFTMGNKNTTLTAKWVYTIGDGVYADYDKSTKTLSIYGSGIIDYNYTGSATDSYSSSFQTGRFETMMNTIGKSNITSIVVSNTGIYLPTNCAYMFYNYTNLTTLDVSNLDTSQVTDMRYMFCYCKKLTALDVSNFDTSQVTNVSCMFYSCTSLTTLDVSNFDTSQVTDMSYMFYYCNKLTTLDVSNFDTSQVTDMSYMFYVCYSLTTLDVSNFDTSKVTNMQSMFSDCSRLSTLDVSNFDTSQVTDMEQMFEYCSNLTTLDVSNFNTSQVTDMMDMFVGCSRLTTLDLSNFDTNQVTDMRGMFESCSSLITLDLSKFDTSKVTNMVDMFDGCSSLITLDLSNFDTSQVTTMYDMFCECSSLTILNLSNFNTSQVTDMEQMFEYCSNLTTLDVSNFDTSQVEYMDCMFYNCSSLTTLDLSSFDTSQVENMYDMFYNCSSLTSLDLSSFDTSQVEYMYDMFSNCSNLTSLDLSNFDTSNVSYMEDIFYNCTDLITIYTPKINSEETVELPAQYYNASNVNDTNIYESFDNTTFSESVKLRQTDKDYKLGNGVYAKFDNTTGELVIFGDGTDDLTIDRTRWDEMKTEIEDSVESIIVKNNEIYLPANCSYMFSNFSSLTELDLSNFDTSQVTSMERMFESCSSLTRLDLSNFDTSKVTNMSYMFEDCSSLTTLDLSNFDTTQVISMEGMFYYCSSLTTLDLSNFDTIQVIDMSEMFYNCNSLTTLDVSNFDTSNVTRMNLMFEDCSSLTSLNLSNFDTTQVTDMCEMFDNCSSLTSLDLNSFDTSQVTDMSYMFDNCSSLTSLNLSNFDTSKVTDMQLTFYNCSSLTNLDLSNFDTSQVTSMYYMFFNCTNLITIYTPKTNSSKTVELPAQYYNASNVNDINIYESFDNTTFFESIELKKIQVELHTVTVNPNGGTWDSSTSNKNFTLEYLETTTISNPSKTGYTFTEWVVSGRGSSINDTIFTMGYEDTTLTANWTINSYKVTYDYSTNGGTSSTKTEATVSYNSAIDLTPTATKSGWTFVGWNTNKDAQTGLTSLTIGTSNVTLYAIYKKDITATVKYYNNQTSTETKTIYNTATSTSFTLPAIASQTVSSVTYAGRGYSEATTANGSIVANSGASVTLSADKTYYASYSADITGTFYYYSGSAQTSSTAKATRYMNYTGTYVNSNYTVPTATTLSGYTQRGWSTGTAGTSTVTTPTTENTSYYMSYTYTVTLTYNANGGSLDSVPTQTGTAYMNSTGEKTGASITITTAIPTRTGYTFGNAWNTNQTKTGTSYTKNTAYSFTSDATLYAEWTANTDTAYVVKHWQQNVGADSTQNSTNYTLKDTENKKGTSDSKVTPAVQTYTGFTSPSTQEITISADGTTVLNYYYTRKSYSVTLNKGTGITAVTGADSYQYGASVTIDATVANGYTWSGWTGTHTENTKNYTFTMPASNVTDTANTTINSYTLTVNPNKGTWENSTESQNFTLNYLETKTITNPSRTGYTFAGWTLTGTASSIKDSTDTESKSETFTMGYENATLTANWTANIYTVKYNGNGATSGSTEDSTHTYDEEKALTTNEYERKYTVTYNHNYDGSEDTSKVSTYTFAGWANTADGEKAYDNEAKVVNLASNAGDTVNLYAVWTSSSVTYAPTRTGYTFAGWCTDAECTNSVSREDGEYTPSEDIILYADWTANTDTAYVVKHWQQNLGAEIEENNTNYTLIDTDNLKGTTDSKVTPAVKDYTGFTAPETQEITISADGSTVLNYYYTRNSYAVTLEKDTGITEVTGTGSYQYGASVIIDATVANGYTWSGWTGTHTENTKNYTFTMPASDVTDTANTIANTYTVKYNGNGATSGETADSEHTYDAEKALTTNGYERKYTVTYNHNYDGIENTTKTATYTFAGWANTADGEKVYDNEAKVVNLASNAGDTVNLYALWNSETLTYAPTKTGYTFAGWCTDAECTNSVSGADGVYTPSEDITLYAEWTANTDTAYTVKHWQQNLGAEKEENNTNYTLIDTDNLKGTTDSKVTPAVKDYTGFTAPSTQEITISADGSTVLNYYYTRNSYTVTLEKDTGITEVTGAGSYQYGASVTIDATVANGYTWSGWTGTHTENTKQYTFTMPASNVTDTANTIANTYTVKYNGNGATSGSTEDSTHTYDEEKALTANGYERKYTVTYNHNYDGSENITKTATYTFAGWANTADGEKVYDDETSVINLASNAGDTVNLYALWTSASVTYAPTRTGYTFAGWCTDAECTNSVSGTNGEYTPSEDITLYAKWTINSYKVTYNYSENGGTDVTTAEAIVDYNSEIDLTPTATKSGWTFIGWNTDKEAKEALSSLIMETSNVTLYAIYKKDITATVKYYNNQTSSETKTIYNKETNTNFTLPEIASQTVDEVTYTARGYCEEKTNEIENSGKILANANITVNGGDEITLSENKTYYASYSAEITGTFYYYNGSEQTSNEATATRYMNYTGDFVNTNYELPEVTQLEGYTQRGWTTGTEGTSTVTVTPTTASTQYYMTYTYPVTIMYDANKGVLDSIAIQTGTAYMNSEGTKTGANITITNAIPTRIGYTFGNAWNTNENKTGTSYTKSAVYSFTSDATLYAEWIADTDTVYVVKHWKQNLGTEKEENSTNYTLIDTENKKGASDSKVTPAVQIYTGFTSPEAQEITISADGSTVLNYYYTRNSYTVNLSKETGITAVTGIGTYQYGASVTIDATVANGYTWSEWTGTHTENTKQYTFTMPASNVTDTANAIANTYTIKYNGNGATSGSTENSIHTYDEEKALTANGFERKYTVTYNHNYAGSSNTTKTATYTFAGWANTENGEKVYDNEANVINLASNTGDTVNLYALWNSETLTYVPVRIGYTFEGWYKEAECTNSISGTDGVYTPAENITVYAKWEVDENQTKELSYTVEYYKDGEKVEADTQVEKTVVQVLEPDTMKVDKDKINLTDKYIAYELDKTEPATIPDVVENETVIKVYYVYNAEKTGYKIEYYYDNEIDNSKTELVEAGKDEVITQEKIQDKIENNKIEGYKLFTVLNVPLTANEPVNNIDKNVIKVHYMKVENSNTSTDPENPSNPDTPEEPSITMYKIEYYYDNNINTAKTELIFASVGDKVSKEEITEKAEANIVDGYKLITMLNTPLIVREDVENNVIKVHYMKVENSNTPTDPENPSNPDTSTEPSNPDTPENPDNSGSSSVSEVTMYKVEYYYDNVIDTSKSEAVFAEIGDIINEDSLEANIEANKVDGYKLVTTLNTPLTVSEDVDNNVIKVHYKKTEIKPVDPDNTEEPTEDTSSYEIEYYYNGSKDNSLTELIDVEKDTVVNNETVSDEVENNKTSDFISVTVIKDPDTNKIKVYYVIEPEESEKSEYTIEYYYDNILNKEKTETIDAIKGDVITEEKLNEKIAGNRIKGYILSELANTPLVITENTEENVIRVYYNKDQFNYRIEYYYNINIDEALTEVGSAEYLSVIDQYEDKNKKGYILDKVENFPLTITDDEDENVIKVYYKINEEEQKELTYDIVYYKDGEIVDKETITRSVQVLLPNEVAVDKALIKTDKYEDSNFIRTEPEEIPENIESGSEIKVYYEIKTSQVVVKYVDKVSGEELSTETMEEKLGTEYSLKAKEIEGYTLIESPDELTGTYTYENQEKVFYYAKTATVKVKYLEQDYTPEDTTDNLILSDEEIILGYEEKEYETSPKEIENYELLNIPENATGTMKVTVNEDGTTNSETEVIYYYAQKTKVTVNHINIISGENLDTETVEGLAGDAYLVKAKDFEGYVLIEEDSEGNSLHPANAEGTMAKNEIVVNYYYKHISAGVVEKHIDKISGEVLENTAYEGNEGDAYSTSSKDFEGYDLLETDAEGNSMLPENASGTMTQELIEVKYYYVRKATVKVEYLDRNTNEEIAEAEVISGHEGDEYTVTAKEFEDYTLIEVDSEGNSKLPANAEGTMQVTLNEDGTINAETKVIYYYAKKSAGVIESHIDEKSETIIEDIVYEGLEGDSYTASSKEFEGYDLDERILPENSEGTMSSELIEVKYYYLRKATVKVQYIDEFTNEVIEEVAIEGHEGDFYRTEEKTINNYKLDEENLPENSKGTMEVTIDGEENVISEIVVKYYYKKVSSGVVEKHIDIKSNETLIEKIYSGNEGDSYKTTSLEFKDYDLVERDEAGNSILPTNAEGTMQQEQIEVNYYYIRKATVRVQYVDNSTGEKLLDDTIINGYEDDYYKVEPKEIEGYTLLEKDEENNLLPANAEGEMQVIRNEDGTVEAETLVIYYYEKVKEPESPTTPEEPTEPETPATPEEPVEPETPVTPVEPTEPETPVTPEEPTEPDDSSSNDNNNTDNSNSNNDNNSNDNSNNNSNANNGSDSSNNNSNANNGSDSSNNNGNANNGSGSSNNNGNANNGSGSSNNNGNANNGNSNSNYKVNANKSNSSSNSNNANNTASTNTNTNTNTNTTNNTNNSTNNNTNTNSITNTDNTDSSTNNNSNANDTNSSVNNNTNTNNSNTNTNNSNTNTNTNSSANNRNITNTNSSLNSNNSSNNKKVTTKENSTESLAQTADSTHKNTLKEVIQENPVPTVVAGTTLLGFVAKITQIIIIRKKKK